MFTLDLIWRINHERTKSNTLQVRGPFQTLPDCAKTVDSHGKVSAILPNCLKPVLSSSFIQTYYKKARIKDIIRSRVFDSSQLYIMVWINEATLAKKNLLNFTSKVKGKHCIRLAWRPMDHTNNCPIRDLNPQHFARQLQRGNSFNR